MAHCYTKHVECPDISCSECSIKTGGSKMEYSKLFRMAKDNGINIYKKDNGLYDAYDYGNEKRYNLITEEKLLEIIKNA